MAQGPESTRAKIQKRKPAGPSGGQGQRTWLSKPPKATSREPSQVKDTKSNADRKRSEDYQNSDPYRAKIFATYREQPTKRRSQIASHAKGPALGAIARYHNQALARNQELARSQATKDTKGNADYFRGRDSARAQRAKTEAEQSHKELVALANEIIMKHRDTALPGVQGDTKGNFERLTADAFKLTPEFAQDFSTAANAGTEYRAEKVKAAEAKKYGGFMGAAAGFLVNKGPVAAAVADVGGAVQSGVTAIARKVPTEAAFVPGLGLATGIAKASPETAGNAARELVDLPANAIPSLYYAGEPTVHGHPEETVKRLAQPYGDLIKDPVKAFKEHPLSSTLMVAGGVRGLDRGIGKAKSTITGKTVALDKAIVPGTALEHVRPAARGIVTQTLQQRADERRSGKPIMQDTHIRQRVAESVDHMSNQIRRASEKAIETHFDKVKAGGGKITLEVRQKSQEFSKKAASIARQREEQAIVEEFAVRKGKGGTGGGSATNPIGVVASRKNAPLVFNTRDAVKNEQNAISFIQRRNFGGVDMTAYKDPYSQKVYVMPTAAAMEMGRFGIGELPIKQVWSSKYGHYLDPNKNAWAKAAQATISAFRRTVLAFPGTKWMTGNYVESAARMGVNHVGPRSFIAGIQAKRYAMKNWSKEEWDAWSDRVLGTGHFGMNLQLKMHTHPDEFAHSNLQGLAKAMYAAKYARKSPLRPLAAGWEHWTNITFNILNGKMENAVRLGMAGKALRESPLMNEHVVKLHAQAIRDAMDGTKSIDQMAHLGREVDRMFGKYGKFSPHQRALVANYTPFLAWYMNATKFVLSELPKNHPVATALIASASQVSEEWRKDKGLAKFMDGAVPGWLQGSVPLGKDKLRVSRYTPFGIAGDPGGSWSSVLLPMFASGQNNLAGKDWKGDDLPTNIASNDFLRFGMAAISTLGATIPIAGAGYRLSGAEEKVLGKDPTSFGERANKEFNPMKPVSPQKPKNGNKGPFDQPKTTTSNNPFDTGKGKKKSANPFDN